MSCGDATSVATKPAPESSTAKVESAPATEFLHGRVVDQRTGQGVPLLWVELDTGEVPTLLRTDERGEFALETELTKGKVRSRVRLAREGEQVVSLPARIDHDPETSAETTHILRVDVGPCFALNFSEAAAMAPERWEARLVERRAGAVDREWSWRQLTPGELPLVRYPKQEHAVERGYHARLELRFAGGGDWFGRAPVTSTASVAVQEIPLRIVQYAAFGGVVRDTGGRSVRNAEVMLHQERGDVLPAYAMDWRRAWVRENGEFLFEQSLEPGRYHVRVLSDGRAPSDFDIMIDEGGLDGYEIKLSELHAEYELHGRILRRSKEARTPAVVLSLRSADRLVERVLHPMQDAEEQRSGSMTYSQGHLEFHFADLPMGDYELALFPLSGERYELEQSEFHVPRKALKIERVEESPSELIAIDVEDYAGGERIPRYHVSFNVDGWWNPEGHWLDSGAPIASLPANSPVTWMVHAPGYRAAYGDRSKFIEVVGAEAGEARRARVKLQAGWAAELWLKATGPRGVPQGVDTYTLMAMVRARESLAGVRVLADGELLGVSDEHGRVRLTMEAKPAQLSFEKEGWQALNTESFAFGELLDAADGERRSAVIWMAQQ